MSVYAYVTKYVSEVNVPPRDPPRKSERVTIEPVVLYDDEIERQAAEKKSTFKWQHSPEDTVSSRRRHKDAPNARLQSNQ